MSEIDRLWLAAFANVEDGFVSGRIGPALTFRRLSRLGVRAAARRSYIEDWAVARQNRQPNRPMRDRVPISRIQGGT